MIYLPDINVWIALASARHNVMGAEVRDPMGAWTVYDTMRSAPQVTFLAERTGLSERWSDARSQLSGGTNTITDAYLAVFAKHGNATVVTFDRGFKAVGGCSSTLIP